tara:strand:- start:227 stop:466 length:240 start_codon:yes stop_codon:yes gene_type:complete
MSRYREKVPQYIHDLENGKFAEIIEDDGEMIFAYYINTKTGITSPSVGSINTEKNDPFISFLSDQLCVKTYMRLKELRK